MSSRDERRQRKIPFGSYRREEVVNSLGTAEVPSSSSARTEERSCRDETELMEQVVSRPDMMDAYGQVLGGETKRPTSNRRLLSSAYAE
jgi:hypothetical protein